MKKVLIIGENSYIGKSFESFVKNKSDIAVTLISSRNDFWKTFDFSGYDNVLYCAGIAHIKQKNKQKPLYYAINCDLTVDIAKKSKDSGIKQFIFLSSMAVYGTKNTKISKQTLPNPDKNDFYGESKLKAEKELLKLSSDNFKLCIIRPPMVYGKNCKGNFQKLVKLIKNIPLFLIFPDYFNKRSMIYIDNLCYYILDLIKSKTPGNIFFPQNKDYVCTTELVKKIAKNFDKRIITTKLFNPFISFFIKHISFIKKLFGDLIYTSDDTPQNQDFIEFNETISQSIKKV